MGQTKKAGRPKIEDPKIFIPIGVRRSTVKSHGGYEKTKKLLTKFVQDEEKKQKRANP